MEFYKTNIDGCKYVSLDIYGDNRGEFLETYSVGKYINEIGGAYWLQSNVSISHKNVLRGLHHQNGKYSQAKLITVLQGKVQDVIVDCRINSPTFGNVVDVILDSKNTSQIFVPKGCAHGFLALEDNTIFHYLCDYTYTKNSDGGIIYNDPHLNIDWKLDGKPILSEKDLKLPSWEESYKFDI